MLRVALVTMMAREMRLNLLKVDQALEMLRVALVTILAREMRLKVFEGDQALEMLRVPLVMILAREMRIIFFEVGQRLEMLRVALVTILAGEMRLKIFSTISLANNVTSRTRKISFKFVEKCQFSIAYIAPISRLAVFAARPKLLSLKKLSIAFLPANFSTCGTRTTQSQRIACFNRIFRTNIVTSLLAIACKARLSLHCNYIYAMALKRSSTSCG